MMNYPICQTLASFVKPAQVLATVVGVLIEVPAMLLVVGVVIRTRGGKKPRASRRLR